MLELSAMAVLFGIILEVVVKEDSLVLVRIVVGLFRLVIADQIG